MKTTKEIVEQIAKDLFKEIGLKTEIKTQEDQDSINVQIETQESGLLIGYHGETLNSLQTMINLMAYRQLGQWPRVVVEVGDYRQKRQEVLKGMALSAVESIKQSGEVYHFPPMGAYERRLIHLALADNPEIETYSEGLQDRHVVASLVKKKTKDKEKKQD